MNENNVIIARRFWIYDRSVVFNLRIIKSDKLYDSGEYEDETEIRDDKESELLLH